MNRAPGTSLSSRSFSKASLVGWTAIGLFALVLTWLSLFHHTVGDYGAESDFYGGYAEGARGIQQGVWDARRYVVVGPGYEVALAMVGGVARDFFTGAKLISVAAATGAAAFWFALLTRLIGPVAGLWVVAFVLINPTFLRYGTAASTDMLAVFLQAVCLFTALGARGRQAPLLSGALAGAAVLTRYSSLYLVPILVVAQLWRRDEPGSWVRRAMASAAGFLLVVAPWAAFSVGQGVIPGEGLVRGYAFYANDHGDWNVQDDVSDFGNASATIPSLRSVIGRDPKAFVWNRLRQVSVHLRGDARDLLGWPAAIAALLGLALLWRHRLERRLLPLAIAGVLCFVSLLAAFHSTRYSLPMVLFYASAAAGLSALRLAGSAGAARWSVAGIGIAAIGLTLVTAVKSQLALLREAPREVIAAGQTLQRVAASGSTVIARKGHIGYYSGHPVAPFPRVHSLRELADYARRQRAEYIYFSWFETQMRPELAYLLDPTAAIPGLTVIHSSDEKPAILYRIGPDFGRAPDWIANEFQRSVHLARAIERVQREGTPASHLAVLAIDALLGKEWTVALHHSSRVTETDPSHALAWAVRGEALRRLSRAEEARVAFVRAIELDPSDPAAKIGLGRIELASGNPVEAMHLWRAAARAAEDVRTLDEISRLLGAVADSSGVRSIRSEIQRIEREPRLEKDRPTAGIPPAHQRQAPLVARVRRMGPL
ncbi:MAG TPA: glycosyltransferase family 39 protein [Candidatus Eisenbacteria bacterium]|nr:glycosyltransferase family 39 protein [Candidatus Eisenbacteria bacterium]